MDIKQLLEKMDQFAGQAVGQKPGDQWRGTDSAPPGKKLVGDSILKDLSKGKKGKSKEQELSEEFAKFMEDNLGVEEKRPGRKSDRPSREYTKHGKPSKRYTTVKEAEQRLGVRVIGHTNDIYRSPFSKLFLTQEDFKAWKAANEEHGNIIIDQTKVVDTTSKPQKPQSNEPDNRESFQLFHGRGSDQGKPLTMTRDQAIKFCKNQVMQQNLLYWAALVDSDGKVVWTWDPNGFMPDRFSSGRDTKPLPAQYAQYDQLPGDTIHTSTVQNLVDTNEGLDQKTTKQGSWKTAVLAKYPTATFKDPRPAIPRDGSYHIVAIVNGKVVDELKGNVFKDKQVSEGWATGSDRVSLDDSTSAYWQGQGPLQKEYEALYDQLVPASGAADTLEGEVLRAASKIVYRHFNDGDEFNKASFDQLKPMIGAVTSYDDLAHKATEFALKANGNYHPNAGWDSLDVMDYGPVDDDDDYDDEDEPHPPGWGTGAYDDDEDLEEARSDQVYTVNIVKRSSFGGEGRTRTTSGTIAELLKYFGYTLEVGKSYEHERGRYKINMTPKNINSLVDNLNKAASNGARNGHSSTYYEVAEQEVAEDGDERLELGTYRSDWVEFETAYDEAAQVFATMNDDDIPDAFKPLEDVLDPEVVDALDYGLMGGDETLFKDKLIQALEIAQRKHGTEPRAALHGAVYALGRATRQYSKMSEGWESGPEEYKEPYDDADDAYDRQRQEKIDTEAEREWAKLPKVSTYKLSGRGPNMEPNYEFGDEFDSMEKALEYRKQIMADPKTPYPEHIGIRTITRVVNKDQTNEAVIGGGGVKDLEDYTAKRDYIYQQLADPKQVDNYAHFRQALYDLMRTAREKGIKIEESRAHKQLATWFKNRELAQKFASGEVKVPTPQERNAKIEKPKKQIKEFGANPPQGTAGQPMQQNDPKQAQALAQATNTLKAATGSTAPTTSIAKAIDSASQGKPVGQQDMKALEPLMKDVATIAQTPQLAGQLKSVLGQVQQVQQKEKQQQQKTT